MLTDKILDQNKSKSDQCFLEERLNKLAHVFLETLLFFCR